MAAPVIQPNFSAGEISPDLYGHIDLAKYHNGVALGRNMYVNYRGGLVNRSGTRYVGPVQNYDKINRLIPFQFSTLQTYVLVFSHLTMRVIKDGGLVTEPVKTVSGISRANAAVVSATSHGFSNGDLVFIDAVAGMTQVNNQFYTVSAATTNAFTLVDIFGNVVNSSAYSTYTSGGTVARVYTMTTPYADTDLALLKYSQSADTMNLSHPNYAARQLTRMQHWAWSLSTTRFVPSINPPANVTAVSSDPSGTVTYYYVVTALGGNGVTESVASSQGAITDGKPMSTDVGVYNTVSWDTVPGATQYNVYRTIEVRGAGTPPPGSLLGFVGSAGPDATSFIDNNITPDFARTPPMADNPFDPTGISSVTITAGGTGYADISDVSFSGGGGSDAAGQAYATGGVITRVAMLDEGTGYTSAPSVSFTGGSGAAGTAVIATLANNPGCSAYFQGRLFYAGTNDRPDLLAASRSSDYQNFGFSIPERADDAINVNLISQQLNAIKHLLSLNSLIALTSSGAWKIDGGTQSDVVTPTSLDATPQAYSGCSDVPPLVINFDILYTQAVGAYVRDLTYNFYVNLYTGTDISLLSNHLFETRRITEWAYAEEPNKLIWAVCDDGMLLSLTFLKEQDVIGWTRHDSFNGLFKSVASIIEGDESSVYFVMQRAVNGRFVQYIERMQSRMMGGDAAIGIPADLNRAWFVDCGLKYPQVYPSATLTPVLTNSTVQPVSQVVAASVVDGGSNYSAPVLTVNDTQGSGAVLAAIVIGGIITSVTVISRGSGYVAPTITISDATGTDAVIYPVVKNLLTFNASAAVFASGDEGKFLRINGGLGVVFAVNSTQQISVDIQQPLTRIWPARAGQWSYTAGTATVSGLTHLEGQTVAILANGSALSPAVVTNGMVTLDDGQTAYDSVVVGLPIQSQVKTLYLATGVEPTEQGRRKKIPACTLRLKDSRGLKIGTTFDNLIPMKQRYAERLGYPIVPFTGDLRTILPAEWNLYGQIAIQQDDPLPWHLLAAIPEVAIGDTPAR